MVDRHGVQHLRAMRRGVLAEGVSWDGALPVDFEPAVLPSAAQMEELFMERRTIRSFTDEPLDRSVLEEIVSWGGYAPTHDFHLRCIAVDDPAIIEAFDEARPKTGTRRS